MPYIIAVSNEEGGVAKTTTTMSLGATLVENGKRVLLIDLDPQGNLALAAGLELKELEKTSRDVLLDGDGLNAAISLTGTLDLDIVPTNNQMDQAESLLPVRLDYANLLREAVQRSVLSYDYMLLD